MTEFRRIYADYAASTPLRKEVREYMYSLDRNIFGNPSSVHYFGREARNLLEESREKVARLIGANPGEIIFTSGGTEANNLALNGFLMAAPKSIQKVLASPIEHPSVRNTLRALEKKGFNIRYLPVDGTGIVDGKRLHSAISDGFKGLITIVWGNGETGTLNPIEDIARLASGRDLFFHTDAVQVAGKIPVKVHKQGIDLLTLSAHKIYGPKGVGALYVNENVPYSPVIHGGQQERGHRAGTENIVGIAGFGKAAELALSEQVEYRKHLSLLEEKLHSLLIKIPGIRFVGHPLLHIPGILAFICEGLDERLVVLNLDLEGIAVSSGSACSSGSPEPSYVLKELGYDTRIHTNVVRISLGKYSTVEDVKQIASKLKRIINRLREES